jgi:hypothetical protein
MARLDSPARKVVLLTAEFGEMQAKMDLAAADGDQGCVGEICCSGQRCQSRSCDGLVLITRDDLHNFLVFCNLKVGLRITMQSTFFNYLVGPSRTQGTTHRCRLQVQVLGASVGFQTI